MNFNRTKAIANKEFIQIMRDPRSLGLAFVIPIILIMLFGFGLSLDIQHVPMAVWNQDGSITSHNFLYSFKFSPYFRIMGYYDNYPVLEHLIDKGDAIMALVIHKDFTKYIESNGLAPVQLILDGSDSNTGQISSGYVNAVITGYNTNYIKNALASANIENSDPVDLRPRIWYNQDLESKCFIIPGLIAIIITIVAALLTSLTIAREWERGTMEQLISTPVRVGELIIGKIIPYFIIGYIDLAIAVAMGVFVFQVPLRGSLIFLFFVSGLFLIGALMYGIYISVVAKSQLMASQFAMLTAFLPTFMLSGFTYEIFNMPKWVQAFTYIIPARYFIVILRGVYLKAIGINFLWGEILALFIFALITTMAAIFRFKKKMA